jgi:exosome complex component RRP42
MNEELKEHRNKSLVKNVRLDGRKKDQFRKIEVERGVSKTADGSARVKCGDTEVIAGVKMSIGEPYPDIPDEGVLIVGTELLPLSNPEFETGPPSIESIEISRVVDRPIRESKSIDTKKLCIKKGEQVWLINLDITPINHDGNLIDISMIAAVNALKETKLPEQKDGKIDFKKKTTQGLPLVGTPICVTVLKIGDNFIVDPTEAEEKVLDARLTVGIIDGKLCSLQKGGDYPLTIKDVETMIDLAFKKGKELEQYVK